MIFDNDGGTFVSSQSVDDGVKKEDSLFSSVSLLVLESLELLIGTEVLVAVGNGEENAAVSTAEGETATVSSTDKSR